MAFTQATLTAQNGPDEQAIKEVVERLFRALEKKNFDAVMACWSRRTPGLDAIKEWVQDQIASSISIQYENFVFTRWRIGVERAEVYVRFDGTWQEKFLKQAFQGRACLGVQLVKEDGVWRWFQKTDPSYELVPKLSAASTVEERLRLMQEGRDILTADTASHFRDEATTQAEKGNLNEAIRLSGIAFEIARALGDDQELAWCYHDLAQIHIFSSAYTDAIDTYQRALSLFQNIKDSHGQVRTLNRIGSVYILLDDYHESVRWFNLALKLAQEKEDREGEGEIWMMLGATHSTMGEYKIAVDDYASGLKIAQEMDYGELEARVLIGMVEVYTYLGNYNEALKHYEKFQEIAKTSNDMPLKLGALNSIGLVYRGLDRYLEALKYFEEAAELADESNLRPLQALVHNNLGFIYYNIGRQKQALNSYELSLNYARGISKSTEAMALINKSVMLMMMDEPEEALKAAEEGLKIMRQISNKRGELKALLALAMCYIDDDNAKALETLLKAFEIAKEKDLTEDAGFILGLAGAAAASEKNYELATTCFQNALAISNSIGNQSLAFMSYYNLAYTDARQKKWETSISFYKKAIERVEYIRNQVKEPLLQADLFSSFISNGSPYFGLVYSLRESGADISEIFKASESGKARSLIDIMERGNGDLIQGLTGQDRDKEQALRSKIIEIEIELNSGISIENSAARVDALKRQLDVARRNYDKFRRDLYLNRPELRIRNAQFDPATLAQLSQGLFRIEPNACLLSYLVDDDDALLLVITRGENAQARPKVTSYTLKTEEGEDLTIKELDRRLRDLRLRCKKPFGLYKSYAQSLYKTLMASAGKEIAGKSHLIIIPDGPLNTLPFQVLIDEQGKHLIDNYSISYAPSATALLEMMKLAAEKRKAVGNSRSVFVMGRRVFTDQADYRDQELLWAEDQASSIANLFGAKPFIGVNATRANAVAGMKKARYVHFATHGVLNEAAPMYSAIAMGGGKDDDGMLYARDLMDMNLQAELVTLSACDTALGRQVSGEGILGLTWALFVAGTPTSVVTQWSVSDDSMNKLMVEFYRQLRHSEASRKKVSKAEALRRAQLSLMNDPKYNHPYHWAPTVLVGDWR